MSLVTDYDTAEFTKNRLEALERKSKFTPASYVWCDVCNRNARVHDHKCKDCNHLEDGYFGNIHRDGYCMQCHPTLGFKMSDECVEAFKKLVPHD